MNLYQRRLTNITSAGVGTLDLFIKKTFSCKTEGKLTFILSGRYRMTYPPFASSFLNRIFQRKPIERREAASMG